MRRHEPRERARELTRGARRPRCLARQQGRAHGILHAAARLLRRLARRLKRRRLRPPREGRADRLRFLLDLDRVEAVAHRAADAVEAVAHHLCVGQPATELRQPRAESTRVRTLLSLRASRRAAAARCTLSSSSSSESDAGSPPPSSSVSAPLRPGDDGSISSSSIESSWRGARARVLDAKRSRKEGAEET